MSTERDPDAARTLRLALISVGVLVALAWVVVLLVWTDGPFAFTFDDAYYYLAIARNIADGAGSTFDRINATNGYHPLWMAISILPFKLGLDDLGAVRALLILQLVVGWAASLAIVGSIVSRAVDGWRSIDAPTLRPWATATLAAVFGLLVANPFIMKAFVNGLESGVAITVYALLLWFATGRSGGWLDASTRWRLLVSALLALAFLARTDAIILLGCLGLWCLAEAWRARRSGLSVTSSARAIAELFALPALVIVAYLVLNQRAFGTPVQVSGLVKRATLDAPTLLLFAAFVVVAALIGRHTFRRAHGRKAGRSPRFPLAGAFVIRTGWFAAFGVLVVGYYNVLQVQQWLWYYAPVLLYLLILLVLAVADIIDVAAAGARPNRSPARTLAPVMAVFLLPLALGFAYELRSFVDPDLLSIQQANRDAGEWMRANTPDDAVFASWDAGVLGYFSHRRVVNIDGVVNSLAYYDAMRAGTVSQFLRCEGVGYIVNHGTDVNGRDPDIDKLVRDVYGTEAADRATVVHAVPFRYSGSLSATGAGGDAGLRDFVVHVYAIPPDLRGPRAADDCDAALHP